MPTPHSAYKRSIASFFNIKTTITSFMVAMMSFSLFSIGVLTADALSVVLQVESDGTNSPIAFNGTDGFGNDSSPNNGIVRSSDRIVYRWELSSQNIQERATISHSLPDYMSWSSIPSLCVRGRSEISFDKRTITCVLENIPAGTVIAIPVEAFVELRTPNNTTLSTQFSAWVDPAAPIVSNSVSTVVTSGPEYNGLIRLSQATATTLNGVPGYKAGLSFGIYPANLKQIGNEPPISPTRYSIDISGFGPNAQLFPDGSPSNCSLSKAQILTVGAHFCSPKDANNRITVDFDQVEMERNYYSSTVNATYFIGAFLQIFIPASDVPDTTTVTARLDPIAPVSITSQPNLQGGQEPLFDNVASTVIDPIENGIFGKTVIVANGLTDPARQQDVIPGEQVLTTMNVRNLGAINLSGYSLCDKINRQYYRLTQPATVNIANGIDYKVQYGNGSYADYNNDGRVGTCDDGDSPDGWWDDPSQVPGGLAGVSKVRFQFAPGIAGNSGATVSMPMAINEYNFNDPNQGPVAEGIHRNFASVLTQSGWVHEPSPDAIDAPLVGYVNIVANDYYMQVRVQNGSAVRADPGETLVVDTEYTLNPDREFAGVGTTFENTFSLATPSDYIFQEVLSGPAPSRIDATTFPGTTLYFWDYPGAPIQGNLGLHRSSLSFRAPVTDQIDRVDNLLIDATYKPLPARFITPTASVRFNNGAVFNVRKSVDKSLAVINEEITYTLSYANLLNTEIPSADIIDQLPFNGDGRGTDLNGTIQFKSAQAFNNEIIWYTNAPSAAIVTDPADPSNQVGGSTPWCAELSGGSCPSSPAEVTGVRVIAGTIPAAGQQGSDREIQIVMFADQIAQASQLNNNYQANPGGFTLKTESNTVQTDLLVVDFELDKTVDIERPIIDQIVTYSIVARNRGGIEITNAQIRENLPEGLEFVSATAEVGAYDETTNIWSIPSIPAQSEYTLTLTAVVRQRLPISNNAEIIGFDQRDLDNNITNDSSTVQIVPQPLIADFAKTVSNAILKVGDETTYTMTATNQSEENLQNAFFQDVIPAELEYVDGTCTLNCSFDPATNIIRWDIGGMDIGETFSATFNARVRDVTVDSIINNASFAADDIEPIQSQVEVFVDQTPDPADIMDPTDPVDPTTPTNPADPTTPTTPITPTDPTDPTNPPVVPTDPTLPVDPVNPPIDSNPPVDPTVPNVPSNPDTPTTPPVDTTDPITQPNPSTPSNPTADPTLPVDPTNPSVPNNPSENDDNTNTPTNPTNPSGTPPVASDDSTTTSRTNPITIPVLNNDIDPQQPDSKATPQNLTRIILQPAYGTAVIDESTGTILYTPNPNSGQSTDVFVYQICNEFGCDSARVTVKLSGEVLGAQDRVELARTGGFGEIALNTIMVVGLVCSMLFFGSLYYSRGLEA